MRSRFSPFKVIKSNVLYVSGMGLIGCTIFCASALVLWYGVELIITENYDNGAVISVSSFA